MKLISWNVNGLRAVYQKNFTETFQTLDADIFCLQETKMQEGQLDVQFDGYESYWSYAEKKGYSGTAVFTRLKSLRRVDVPVLDPEVFPDNEGRIVALEYDKFFEERGMAHRLLHLLVAHSAANRGGRHPQRNLRQ